MVARFLDVGSTYGFAGGHLDTCMERRAMMKTRRIILALGVLMGMAALLVSPAAADPLPDRDILKFVQRPMIATPIAGEDGTTMIYWGHDEESTIYRQLPQDPALPIHYQGIFMADDFADRSKDPVVHIKWWGSYLQGEPDAGSLGVRDFLIVFESDKPAGTFPGDFSRPDQPLLTQVVRRGPLGIESGTFTETWIRGPDPILGEALYEYNAELAIPFDQEPDTVYWLKIAAMVDVDQGSDPSIKWGWHNRDYTILDPLASVPPAVIPGEFIDGFTPDGQRIWHFQDDAVSGWMTLDVDALNGTVSVNQDLYSPQLYLNDIDGPGPGPLVPPLWEGIGRHSKDLAFELYTVPEPATLTLLGLGALAAIRRRRR